MKQTVYKVLFQYIKHGSFYLNVYPTLAPAFDLIRKEEHSLLSNAMQCQLIVINRESDIDVLQNQKHNIGTIYIPCIKCPMTERIEAFLWDRLEYSQYVILVTNENDE